MTKEIREALESLLALIRYDMDMTGQEDALKNEIHGLSDEDLKEIVCEYISELR